MHLTLNSCSKTWLCYIINIANIVIYTHKLVHTYDGKSFFLIKILSKLLYEFPEEALLKCLIIMQLVNKFIFLPILKLVHFAGINCIPT